MNPEHLGSDFDDFLREEGILEEVEKKAMKRAELRRRLASREPVHPTVSAADLLREGREERWPTEPAPEDARGR